MRYLTCFSLFIITLTVSAQTSLDQSARLAEARTKLTSDFAKIQNQLRSADSAERSAGETGLSQMEPKLDSIRDDLIDANQKLIEALNINYQPGGYSSASNADIRLFFGAYDPSATIVATLGKLMRENLELPKLSLPSSPPFSPQDLNTYQQVLDRLKKAIDEHKHAAANHSTTLLQRRRKAVTPSKTPGKLPR